MEEISDSLISGVEPYQVLGDDFDEGVPTEDKASSKKKTFRLQAKSFFLTYPQCKTTKETARDNILAKWPQVKYIVCHELHKSGDDHLHAYLLFEEKLRISGANCFDFIAGQHGKYESARNQRNSIQYISKKGDYISNMDVENILAPKEGMANKVATMLNEGKSLEEVREVSGGYYMMHKRKIEEYEAHVLVKRFKDNLKPWLEFTPHQLEGMNSESRQIAEWLNLNINKSRKFKQSQLYVFGPRNMGKTTLITWLMNFVCVYLMPRSEDFYDLYDEDFHSLVVLDEFKADKTVQFLNSWLEGSKMSLRKKGSQGLKQKNLPMIILSNYSLAQCYPKMAEKGYLDTLECRLEFVQVTERLNLFNLQES